jgi:type IV secretion system protein VirB1
MDFIRQIAECAPTVHVDTMRRIVQVESGFNPYAIGVVGAQLQRQPRSSAEALATIRWLDANGYNYSVGLAQVNQSNFRAHGLTPATALLACPNLRAGGAILTACFRRASKPSVTPQTALRAAFSCYESGNFRAGFTDGYVLKVLTSGVLPAPRARPGSP